MKEFQMKILSWISQMDPKYHHKCSSIRKAEGSSTLAQRRKQCEDGGRQYSNVATDQGLLGNENDSLPHPLEEAHSAILPFNVLASGT
jgi:hypothetical protein